MTSIIKLHAISGVEGEGPPCYILQIDEFKFLLDCGWDEMLNIDYINVLKKYVSKIDAVLLSHPDQNHLGALPYLVGKCGLSCPVYATIPVFKMGQMFMYDFLLSKNSVENFELFTLDDVDSAFDKVIQLKYNQSINLKGKGYGLTITPLPAGHMIGGTIWKIVKIGEEDIYYAIDYNHKKERHLNGCELEKISRPSLLITDAFNATYTQARRRTRDEQLMTNILQTLKNGGNVLICTDTAGRILELAHMLDQLWRNKESGLYSYSLALLSNVAYHVIEFAKSQIEWMSDKLMRSFEGARNNPFQFKHLQLCHSLAELNRISSPKVVLASMPDMECGFSRDLFMLWCQDRRNSIILTSRTSEGTLSRKLYEESLRRKDSGGIDIELDIKQKVRLEGRELEEHYRKMRETEYRVKKEKREAMMDSDDSDDSDTEIKITGIYHGSQISHDLFIKPGMETRVEAGLFKTSKSKYPSYPIFEEKLKFDDYGEIIRQEDYLLSDVNTEHVGKNKISLNTNMDIETEIPTKTTINVQRFAVNCQINYIDFEGRSDGESIQKIIEQVKPRRLIITRGLEESVKTLEEVCKKYSPDTRVYIPKKTGVVDVTSESLIYQVKLKDALVSSLIFKKGKDAELAWVDGQIILEEEFLQEENQVTSQKKDEVSALLPTLEPLRPSKVVKHPTVFVNELKLSDFKQVLQKNGFTSEFSGGVLWCANGTIALRRQEAGKLTVEGILSDDYYAIRDLLYDQYAIL